MDDRQIIFLDQIEANYTYIPMSSMERAHTDALTNIIGVAIYGIIGLLAIFTMGWKAVKRRRARKALLQARTRSPYASLRDTETEDTPISQIVIIERLFKVFLLVFLASRIVWLILQTLDMAGPVSFVFNRLAFAFFYSAFTLIMFYWAEITHKNYYESTSFMPKLGYIFFITNVLVWSLQIVFVILFELGIKTELLYDLNQWIDVGLSALIALGFIFYGIRIICMRAGSDKLNPDLRKELMKMLLATVVFASCFLLRVFMFAYRPVTGKYFDDHTFIILGYYVCEAVPSLVEVYIFYTTKHETKMQIDFIDDLYDQDQQDEHSPLVK
jgi:hypothetical protein